jgi:hypothetical protein
MKTMKACGFVLFAAAVSCAVPHLAEAGAIYIWPYEFGTSWDTGISSAESADRFVSTGYSISGTQEGKRCTLFAPVDLPVGKTVTKLRYYNRGIDGTAHTTASLNRCKMGSSPKMMAFAQSKGSTGKRTVTVKKIEYAEVESNYLYFVEITVANQYSTIYGVKVHYE